MCYQKRLVYSVCNHSATLGMASTCTDGGRCEGTRAHPLKTVRVEQMCPACRERKVKVDNSLTTIAERIRRLRGELARRGFGKGAEGPGPASASASGEAAENGDEDGVAAEKKFREDAGSNAQRNQIGGEKESTMPSDAAGMSSLSAPTPTTDTSVKRNGLFVGGVCLASTSLTTISGKKLI